MRRIMRIGLAAVLAATTTMVFAGGRSDSWMNRENSFYGHGDGRGMHGMGGSGGRDRHYRRLSDDTSRKRHRLDQVVSVLEEEISRYGEPEWEIVEVMEFEFNFYAQIGDRRDDRLITEVLIDPYTGYVRPEYGPNMMWNLETGHHNRRGLAEDYYDSGMSVSSDEAIRIAGEWLERRRSDSIADDHADPFPGYFTIHTLSDGEITGMLSVNGWTGRVWFHDWHGPYVASTGSHD